MSELVLATADICLHGTSSTLCEWCNYKSRIPHLESQLRDAVAVIKRLREALKGLHENCNYLAYGVCNKCGRCVNSDALSSPIPESLKELLR